MCIEFMSWLERVVRFENGYIFGRRSFFTRDPFSGFKDFDADSVQVLNRFQNRSFMNRKKDDTVCEQPTINLTSVN